jgi:hypothetical protein
MNDKTHHGVTENTEDSRRTTEHRGNSEDQPSSYIRDFSVISVTPW